MTQGTMQILYNWFYSRDREDLLKLNKCYHHSYHTQKPDLSNLIKFVEDALEGANGFFTDDCKIVDIIAKKFWVEGKVWENEKEANQEPRTEISLFEL